MFCFCTFWWNVLLCCTYCIILKLQLLHNPKFKWFMSLCSTISTTVMVLWVATVVWWITVDVLIFGLLDDANGLESYSCCGKVFLFLYFCWVMQLILSLLSVWPVYYNWLLSSINLILYSAISMVLPISDTLFSVKLCSDSSLVLNCDE